MKIFRSTVTLALLLLILAAIIGLFKTRESEQVGQISRTRRAPIVDDQPIRTARDMAKLATTWDEQRYAQQALKLADHAVDLAFSDALRDAAQHPASAKAENKELYARLSKAQAMVNADDGQIEQIKEWMETANEEKKDNLQQQLDIAQAQRELDQDELDDAKGDLVRSGGDPLSRIQRQFKRYQTEQQNDAGRAQSGAGAPAIATAPTDPPTPSLISQFSLWRSFRSKQVLLAQAQQEAASRVTKLNQDHDALEKQVEAAQANKQAVTEAVNHLAAGDNTSSQNTAAALSTLHDLSANQKNLSDFDKRIQDHTELQTVYGNWIDLVGGRKIAALHGILQSALWILMILLGVYLVSELIDRFLTDPNPEQTRFRTLRIIIRFATQAIGVLLILFVIFGTPDQISTILGLATAGLTVALKDFVLGFVGWFVLMGRNGIHVGDWVEINGVVGEVVEVNLLRTVIFETGNWTDTGHPTGRKVAFMNGFAIEGHFFNFSTAGQWLWDELQIMVPADKDPYPVIQAIQNMVNKETEADVHMAEQEWQRATRKYKMHSVTATPAVSVRPTTSGVEVRVRYITRANERSATRTKLYQALVDLLRGRGVDADVNASPTLTTHA